MVSENQNRLAKPVVEQTIVLPKFQIEEATFRIVGVTPLLVCQLWRLRRRLGVFPAGAVVSLKQLHALLEDETA